MRTEGVEFLEQGRNKASKEHEIGVMMKQSLKVPEWEGVEKF
jgi:hypothetical protein